MVGARHGGAICIGAVALPYKNQVKRKDTHCRVSGIFFPAKAVTLKEPQAKKKSSPAASREG